MYGYKIIIKSLPEKNFSCSTAVNNYYWENHHSNNMLEIAVMKAPSVTTVIEGHEFVLTNSPYITCVAGDAERFSFCSPGTHIEITSVAARFSDIAISCTKLCREDAEDYSCLLLPAFSDSVYETTHISRLLNQYISAGVSEAPYDNALCISLFFEMLHIIDKHTRQLLTSLKYSSANYYIKKIDYIIENFYNQKLSLTEIAKEFDVSVAYLSSLYRTASHRTFRDALLEKRMQQAKELILTTSLSLSDIAEKTGICDEIYLRKRFKHFFGVNISEFKKINKGLTLYHDKPLRK